MLCTVSVASNQMSNIIGNHLEAVKHAYQLTPTAPQSPEMRKQTDKLTNNLLSASPDQMHTLHPPPPPHIFSREISLETCPIFQLEMSLPHLHLKSLVALISPLHRD